MDGWAHLDEKLFAIIKCFLYSGNTVCLETTAKKKVSSVTNIWKYPELDESPIIYLIKMYLNTTLPHILHHEDLQTYWPNREHTVHAAGKQARLTENTLVKGAIATWTFLALPPCFFPCCGLVGPACGNTSRCMNLHAHACTKDLIELHALLTHACFHPEKKKETRVWWGVGRSTSVWKGVVSTCQLCD